MKAILKNTLIFVILYFLIYLNQSYIYHQLISTPKLYFWSKRNGNAEKLKTFQKNIDNHGDVDTYFESLEPNKIHEYITPIFDKSLYLKKYIENQFDPELFSKEDGLPYIINMFTTPRTIFGNWVGDSIFRTAFNKRGPNNLYKEHYMQALQKEDLELYRILFKNYFEEYFKENSEVNYFDHIQETNINLTYLIHFREMPTKRDIEDNLLFIKTVKTHNLEKNYIDKQLFNLQQFHRRTKQMIRNSKGKQCIVGKWLKYDNLNEEQIFMEFIHNILGMAINWTNLMYSYVLEFGKGNIPPIPENKEYLKPYLLETMRYLNPVKYTSSKIKNPEILGEDKNISCMAVHDLKIPTRMTKFFGPDTDKFRIERLTDYKKDTAELKGKCPFSGFFESPKGAKVVCGMELYEKEGYTGFGEGYRRCPGEHLSLIFLEEMANHFKKIDYEINLKGGESDMMTYVWGSVDKNLVLKIN